MSCLIPRWTDMAKFEYAPAPESRSIVSLRESYGLFINGEMVLNARPSAPTWTGR